MKKVFSFLRSKKTAARWSSASVAPGTEWSYVGETASLNNIRRDSLYYNTPLMILVSHAVVLNNTLNVCLNGAGRNLVQSGS
jgi:hypothetical protein